MFRQISRVMLVALGAQAQEMESIIGIDERMLSGNSSNTSSGGGGGGNGTTAAATTAAATTTAASGNTTAAGATTTTTTTAKPHKVTLGATLTMDIPANVTATALKSDTQFIKICENGAKKALQTAGVDTSSMKNYQLTSVTFSRRLEEDEAVLRQLASKNVVTTATFEMEKAAATKATTEAAKPAFATSMKDGFNNAAAAETNFGVLGSKPVVTAVSGIAATAVAPPAASSSSTASGAAERGLAFVALAFASLSMF